MSLPVVMKAVKNIGAGKAEIVSNEPLPQVRDGYILVKVSHVAINPTDWKHIDDFPNEGATVGCDFAGTVAALGNNLSKPWAIGDRVAGLVHGAKRGNLQSGSFAEYTEMRAHQGLKIPSNVSDEEAATLGVTTVTVGIALYQMLNLPWPDQAARARSSSVLIYGGSTATGLLAIQMAKLSGLHVLTTCSPHNFDTVKVLGADEVFDYHDADACAAAIKKATGNKLLFAFDTIAEGTSPKICAGALTDEPGRASYVATLPYEEVRSKDDLWQQWLYAYTSFGEEFNDLGMDWPVVPVDEAFTKRWWIEMEKVLSEGKIQLFPILRAGGLTQEGIIRGLDELRQGKVSGGKLVYTVA